MSISMAFRASHVPDVGIISNFVARRLGRINGFFLRVFWSQNHEQHTADHHDES